MLVATIAGVAWLHNPASRQPKLRALNKLQNLHSKELDMIRKAFIKNGHIRFLKSFLCHPQFGTEDDCVKEIMAVDLSKLANLIGICIFLMQTKVYLFWKAGVGLAGIILGIKWSR